MDKFSYYVPKLLDAPPKMFFWEMDEFMVMMAPLGLGIITGWVLSGAALGLLLSWGVAKLKSGQGAGFMLHVFYWVLPNGGVTKLKRTPPSHIREFVG